MPAEENQGLSLTELESIFDELAVEGLPVLPTDFSRADIYYDHD